MTTGNSVSAWAIRCVWLRYFGVFRKNLLYGLMTTFVEPLLYLLSFGYGMGKLVGDISASGHSVSYRQYIFAGVVAQTILFQSFFDAAYGSFIRMYYQKIFKAMATTPITLSEVLWGELLWDASKATFSSTVVLLIGVVTGNFSPLGALCCIPICFLGAAIFSGLGLWTSSISKTIEQINYPQYLIVFPMFLFCGVYFPIEQLPTSVQILAWILPLTSLVSILRSFTLGFPFEPKTIFILLAWLWLLTWASRRTMLRRLVR